jgi:hypothetical protein
MRVLCVGRHAFLSEHLCRVFGEAGAECAQAIGAAAAAPVATRFEPQVLVCDHALLDAALLEGWAREPALAGVPILAVSLTPLPDDVMPDVDGPAAVIYLPSLDRSQIATLLAGSHRAPGVTAPADWRVNRDTTSVHHR